MHDDMEGGVPQPGPQFERVVLRKFDEPVTIRELLHSSLDRLLDYMGAHGEPQGVVSVTNLDEVGADNPFAGHTVVLAIDMDPQPETYEDLNEGGDIAG